MDVSLKILPFLCPILFLYPTLSPLSCCSHLLLISLFGLRAAAAAGKVLSLFPPHFLLLHSWYLFLWSHISFLLIHPLSKLKCVSVYIIFLFFLKSIVHHGTTRTQTQLNLILTSVRSSADSHRCKGDICALIAGFSTHFYFNKYGYEHDQEKNL